MSQQDESSYQFSIPWHTTPYKVDRVAFEKVVEQIEKGYEPLNCTMLGAIFGTPFWQLLILCQVKLDVSELDPKNVTIIISDRET